MTFHEYYTAGGQSVRQAIGPLHCQTNTKNTNKFISAEMHPTKNFQGNILS